MTELPRLRSVRAISRRLGIPGRVVLELFEERGWDVFKIGRCVRLREDDVLALLAECREPTPQAVRGRAELIRELAEREVLGPREGGVCQRKSSNHCPPASN